MAILKQENLVREIVVFLLARREHAAPCKVVYDELATYFPDVTSSEKDDSYKNSRSKWANRVQYARLLGVAEDLIYRNGEGPHPRRGVWVLTALGIRKAQEWQSITTVGKSLLAARAQDLEERQKNDLVALELEHELFEGAKRQRLSSYYERRPELRKEAIRIHGTICKTCGFDFGKTYGEHGQGFIEVHHLKMVSALGKSTAVDPATDMTVLCANCHRMVHRDPGNPLVVDALKTMLRMNRREGRKRG